MKGKGNLLARNKERLEAVFHSLNGDSHSFTCCDLNDNEKCRTQSVRLIM